MSPLSTSPHNKQLVPYAYNALALYTHSVIKRPVASKAGQISRLLQKNGPACSLWAGIYIGAVSLNNRVFQKKTHAEETKTMPKVQTPKPESARRRFGPQSVYNV